MRWSIPLGSLAGTVMRVHVTFLLFLAFGQIAGSHGNFLVHHMWHADQFKARLFDYSLGSKKYRLPQFNGLMAHKIKLVTGDFRTGLEIIKIV